MSDLYIDLLITDNDLTLDAANVPLTTSNRPSIAQDTAHMIRETGYLKETVAERSRLKRRDSLQQIELLMDDDVRLIPGTATITDEGQGHFLITAETEAFSTFKIGVQVD